MKSISLNMGWSGRDNYAVRTIVLLSSAFTPLTYLEIPFLVIVVWMSIHTCPWLVIDCPPLAPYSPPPLPAAPTVHVTCFQRRHHNICYIVWYTANVHCENLFKDRLFVENAQISCAYSVILHTREGTKIHSVTVNAKSQQKIPHVFLNLTLHIVKKKL